MLSLDLTAETLAEAAGLEPAHAMRGDLANRCHTIRRRLRSLAEGEGVEPSRRLARPGFQDQLRATARHLPNLARTLRFELRTSILETDGLPVSLHPCRTLVHVVGLAPTKSERTLDLQSSAFAAQPHMRE